MSELLLNRPAKSAVAHVVLAHGAGSPMDAPFMNIIAEGLAGRDILVSRFEFAYMAMRRIDGKRRGPGSPKSLLQTWRDIIGNISGKLPLFIGGKSMGGRLASMVSDEPRLSGIICLGYPFHPPGKPEKLRTAHLETIPIPTLIVQGERDTFGNSVEVSSYNLSETVMIKWIPDGDHSFKPRRKSGFTEKDNLETAVNAAADFVGKVLATDTIN